MVSAVARRHGLAANQLFVWRRLHREGKLGGADGVEGFVPAMVAPEGWAPAAATQDVARSERLEIVLSEPRRLIVEGDIDLAALSRVIAMLDRR